ncbi:MAG: lipopolysaccharide biosynthesis protein [Aggregatilineales bacterium]
MIDRARNFFRRKVVQDTLALQAGGLGVVALGMLAWIVVPLALGPEKYGTWALAQSLLGIWDTFNLTGLGVTISTRLAAAVGARDQNEMLRLLGAHVRVSLLWGGLSVAAMALAGPPLARALHGSAEIGALAAALSFTLLIDPFYLLVTTALQSRRSMRTLALLQNANQLVLTTCLVTAALARPEPAALVAARLAYSLITALLALWLYRQLRARGTVAYPPLRAVLAQARTASYRPYWRSGLANALDKNAAQLFTQLPLQLTGTIGGLAAAGFLQLALRGFQQASLFTSAVFNNMQAVVPQAVGRGDYARLYRGFTRLVLALAGGGALFYGTLALAGPALVAWVIAPLFGEEWLSAIPLIPVLAVYGVFSTVGGVFGPLYRVFEMSGAALAIKVVSLALLLPLGAALIGALGAVGGAWLVSGLYALSVTLTAAVTLPALRGRARASGSTAEAARG